MKVRKAIKSIVALGAGLTMIGATMFGAMAADLGNYPNQYISDGNFDGLMVVGARAKTEDVLGIVDIATSLQFASKKEVSTTGTTIGVTGDAYLIESNANRLELDETLGAIKSTLGVETGLSVLDTTSIRTSKGRTDVKQLLKFPNVDGALTAVYTENSEADPITVGPYLQVDDGNEIFTYELQFSDRLKSRNTSDEFKDIEDLDLFMLGSVYSIVKGVYNGANDCELTLMTGALTDVLVAGETKTYELDGKSYEVSVVIVGAADGNSREAPVVKLMVNGELTSSLEEGDTEVLSDGTVIGIRDLIAAGSGDGQSEIVSFYVGANKIELVDDEMKVDETRIDGVAVDIQCNVDGNDIYMSKITFNVTAEDELFISEGEAISSLLAEPEAMISPAWDIMFTGLTAPGTTEISLTPSGNDKYYLNFATQDNYNYKLLLIDRKADGTFNQRGLLGRDRDDNGALMYEECVPILEKDLFFVGRATPDEYNTNTHVLQFSNLKDDEITLTEEATGVSTTYKLIADTPDTQCDGVPVNQTSTQLSVGGNDYDVYLTATGALLVDMDASGAVTEGQQPWIVSKGGVRIQFDRENLTALDDTDDDDLALSLNFTVDDELEEGDLSDSVLATISTSGDRQLDLALTAPAGASDEDSDDTKAMNQYGIMVLVQDSDNADTLTLTVPLDQVYFQAYIVGDAVTTGVVSGSTVAEYTRIQVGKSVLDSEITDVAADNLIVVGGPCANTVAATILGIPSTMPACYENFPVQEGQGIIKMVDNGAKVATLVAGFSADDTRKAAQVLANYEDYATDLTGKTEVVVSGTSIVTTTTLTEEVEEIVEEILDEDEEILDEE
jgi:hypothetical protein